MGAQTENNEQVLVLTLVTHHVTPLDCIVFNCLIHTSEANTHSPLISARSEEGRTCRFLSLTTAEINVISALYQW